MTNSFVLKGDILWSRTPQDMTICENQYVVC